MNESQTISFPKEENSPYIFVNNLIEAGLYLLGLNKNGLIFENDKGLLFITLIHLERSIDAYRIFISPESQTDFSEEKKNIDLKLQDFRKEIWALRESLDTTIVGQALDSAGRDFSTRFRELNN